MSTFVAGIFGLEFELSPEIARGVKLAGANLCYERLNNLIVIQSTTQSVRSRSGGNGGDRFGGKNIGKPQHRVCGLFDSLRVCPSSRHQKLLC